MKLPFFTILSLSLCLNLILNQEALAKPSFSITEVASGLYVHQGKNVNLDAKNRDDMANIGFIVGEKCIAVIDTGGSIAIGKQLKQAIQRISKLPICYVINTHTHFDHVLGNYAFQNDQVRFVGHHKLPTALYNNQEFFLKFFATELAFTDKSDLKKRIIPPTLLVKDTLELDLGNRKLLLQAHSTAHTHHDLSIIDTKTHTLWLSDLLFIKRIPSLDSTGSINGWLQTITHLKKYPANQVIPGHGPVTAPWPQAAKAELAYLNTIRTDIRSIINKGGFIEQALKTAGQSEKDKWELFAENHPRNISRAFKELEWE